MDLPSGPPGLGIILASFPWPSFRGSACLISVQSAGLFAPTSIGRDWSSLIRDVYCFFTVPWARQFCALLKILSDPSGCSCSDSLSHPGIEFVQLGWGGGMRVASPQGPLHLQPRAELKQRGSGGEKGKTDFGLNAKVSHSLRLSSCS